MTARSPRRKVATRAPRHTIFVVAEGRTEHQYLNAFARLHRARVLLVVSDVIGRVPRQLIQEAIDRKKEAERDARRQRGSAYDSVWCVFDEDQHPEISEAMALADSNGINVAFSAPCFELWLMLHYRDHSAWISGEEIQRHLKEVAQIRKTIAEPEFVNLIAGYPEAKRRALLLSAAHERGGQLDRANPSSRVWRLVDEIRGA